MPQDVSVIEIVDGMQLYNYWIGCFEEKTDKFCVFEDVAAVFHKIDDDAFKTEKKIYPNDPCACGSGKNTKNAVVKISNHSVRAKSQLPLAC